jgi:hypothetical protein
MQLDPDQHYPFDLMSVGQKLARTSMSIRAHPFGLEIVTRNGELEDFEIVRVNPELAAIVLFWMARAQGENPGMPK